MDVPKINQVPGGLEGLAEPVLEAAMDEHQRRVARSSRLHRPQPQRQPKLPRTLGSLTEAELHEMMTVAAAAAIQSLQLQGVNLSALNTSGQPACELLEARVALAQANERIAQLEAALRGLGVYGVSGVMFGGEVANG
jgi:hypothetical protein